jgi:hypothetical protein
VHPDHADGGLPRERPVLERSGLEAAVLLLAEKRVPCSLSGARHAAALHRVDRPRLPGRLRLPGDNATTTCRCEVRSDPLTGQYVKHLSADVVAYETQFEHTYTAYPPTEASSSTGTIAATCIALLVVLFAGEVCVFYLGREGKSIKKKLEKKAILAQSSQRSPDQGGGEDPSGRTINGFFISLFPEILTHIHWRSAYQSSLFHQHGVMSIFQTYLSCDGVDRYAASKSQIMLRHRIWEISIWWSVSAACIVSRKNAL